jgi:uncharacterized UBP type Zn finger protein
MQDARYKASKSPSYPSFLVLDAKKSKDIVGSGGAMPEQCKHLDKIKVTKTDKDGCEDCLKIGDTWVHLRMCLTCGHVGCCDSSKNKHATKHFHHTNHPLIRSLEPGETWVWCYIDEIAPGELTA